MCGIIAVLSRRDGRTPPTAAELSTLLATALDSVATDPVGAASALTAVDKALRGVPGVIALTIEAELVESIIAALAEIEGKVAELEAEIESGTRNDDAAVIALRDASWAIGRDRIRNAQEVHALADGASEESFNGYLSIQRSLLLIGLKFGVVTRREFMSWLVTTGLLSTTHLLLSNFPSGRMTPSFAHIRFDGSIRRVDRCCRLSTKQRPRSVSLATTQPRFDRPFATMGCCEPYCHHRPQ
ncbi:MAG: hypothetical protein ACPHNZ_01035 [Ilumatobacteraceae bacterium]